MSWRFGGIAEFICVPALHAVFYHSSYIHLRKLVDEYTDKHPESSHAESMKGGHVSLRPSYGFAEGKHPVSGRPASGAAIQARGSSCKQPEYGAVWRNRGIHLRPSTACLAAAVFYHSSYIHLRKLVDEYTDKHPESSHAESMKGGHREWIRQNFACPLKFLSAHHMGSQKVSIPSVDDLHLALQFRQEALATSSPSMVRFGGIAEFICVPALHASQLLCFTTAPISI